METAPSVTVACFVFPCRKGLKENAVWTGGLLLGVGGQRRLAGEVTFEGCEGMSHLDTWGEGLAGGVNTRTQVYPWP